MHVLYFVASNIGTAVLLGVGFWTTDQLIGLAFVAWLTSRGEPIGIRWRDLVLLAAASVVSIGAFAAAAQVVPDGLPLFGVRISVHRQWFWWSLLLVPAAQVVDTDARGRRLRHGARLWLNTTGLRTLFARA